MGVKNNLIVLLILVAFGSCVSRPKYTSYPVDKKSHPLPKEEVEGREETRPLAGESGIDQAKMGQIIQSYLGTPYRKGGSDKKGVDCSGFVMKVYKEYAGFYLPHASKKLFKLARKVDREKLAYGDLVFFSDYGKSPTHVGIYIGAGRFAHATQGYGVIISSLGDESYRRDYIGARRVIP